MLPIEYCDLPEERNKADLYIEGKRWYFEKMPYIYHGLLYLPYREVCHAIGIRPYVEGVIAASSDPQDYNNPFGGGEY